MAIASAAPSVGSVPAPNSSKRASVLLSTFFRILTIFTICDENVERLCSIDCSSPISAYIFENTAASEPSAAVICKPDDAITDRSPTVLSVTVFPPVFGPVTTRVSVLSPKLISFETTLFLSISG